MAVETILLWIGEKVAESVIGVVAKKATNSAVARIAGIGPWGRYRKYVQELRAELTYMPFQYRDFRLTLSEAFVQIQLAVDRHVYLESWNDIFDRAKAGKKQEIVSPEFVNQMPLRSRMVVVGDAGAGKTTVLRYLALCCVSKNGNLDSPNFRPGAIIPVIVPLKALDSIEHLPILSYIQRRYRYFSGDEGLARLTAFAKQSRLLVLLDGYDEVLVSENFNRLQAELRLLYHGSVASIEFLVAKATKNKPSKRVIDFYNAFCLAGGRLILSSRREFFSVHFPRDVRDFVVALNPGLSTNKADLVKNIFNAWTRKSPELYSDKLDHEVFLRQFAKLSDDALQTLATSPLLLTVMCFVYIDHVRTRNPANLHDSPFTKGALSIVDTFIDLLLYEIDLSKTHDLTDLRRSAFLARRSEYHDEKKKFLRFLAARLFLEDITLVKFTYIEARAREFFEMYPDHQVSKEILRELSNRASPNHLCVQLVNSGALLRQPSSPEVALYDFPHRRFREVLAADYFAEDENTERLLSELHRPQVYELLPVFVLRTERFKLVVDRLLSNIFAGIEPIQMGLHLDRLLEEPLYSGRVSSVLFELINGLKNDCKDKALPERLLRHFGKEAVRIADYRRILEESRTSGTGNLAPLLNKPIAAMQTSVPTSRLREMLKDFHLTGGQGWAELVGQSTAFEAEVVLKLVREMCPSGNLRNFTADQAALIVEVLDVLPESPARVELFQLLKAWAPRVKDDVLDPIPFLRGMISVSHTASSREALRRGAAFQWV